MIVASEAKLKELEAKAMHSLERQGTWLLH
jgi:hypothetical protein